MDHVLRVQRTGGRVQAQRRLRRQGRADPRPGSPWRLPAAAVRGLGGGVNVTAVANYGAAAKAWWWSGFAGATGAQVADVLNGKAWPAGGFKQDNVKKRLVAIERSRVDGRFRFVLNEAKPGEAWWWGYGASIANITSVLKGEHWADFKADGIEKRLVSYRRHAGDNWTFLMVPHNGIDWWWYPKIKFDDLVAAANKHGARIIHLDQWGIASGEDLSSFSAILVQNA